MSLSVQWTRCGLVACRIFTHSRTPRHPNEIRVVWAQGTTSPCFDTPVHDRISMSRKLGAVPNMSKRYLVFPEMCRDIEARRGRC